MIRNNLKKGKFICSKKRAAAADPGEHDWQDEHYMPQANGCDKAHLHLVPVEFLSAGLAQLTNVTGVHMNATMLTSEHYRAAKFSYDYMHAPSTGTSDAHVTQWSYLMVKARRPSYADFMAHDAAARAVFGRC